MINLENILNMPLLEDVTNKKATNYNIILYIFKKYKENPDNLKLLNSIRRIVTNIKKEKQDFKSINTNLIRKTVPNFLNLNGEELEKDFNKFTEEMQDNDPDKIVLDNFIKSLN